MLIRSYVFLYPCYADATQLPSSTLKISGPRKIRLPFWNVILDDILHIIKKTLTSLTKESAQVHIKSYFLPDLLMQVSTCSLTSYVRYRALKIVSLTCFINSDILLFDPCNKVIPLASCCSKGQIQTCLHKSSAPHYVQFLRFCNLWLEITHLHTMPWLFNFRMTFFSPQ